MTSRTKRALARVARLENQLADREAAKLAETLLAKHGTDGKLPKDEARRRDLFEEVDRSPLAARVRKKFDLDLTSGLSREQRDALLDLLDSLEYGEQRPAPLLNFKAKRGRGSG